MSLQIFEHKDPLRIHLDALKRKGRRVALIPTMGNLHTGHLKLVELASQLADHLIVSIFVNPTQFSEGEDLLSYPRTLKRDLFMLEEVGCHSVFTPSTEQMYPLGLEDRFTLVMPALANRLCGAGRRGHFAGVAAVIIKLFNCVPADIAVLGEKDYQQLQIIRRLVQDFSFPIEIIGMETVREDDGLAMSSRNSFLNPQERSLAPQLYTMLCDVRRQIEVGNEDFRDLEHSAIRRLNSMGFAVEYVSICTAADLQAANMRQNGEILIAVAAKIGNTRLIDNVKIELSV